MNNKVTWTGLGDEEFVVNVCAEELADSVVVTAVATKAGVDVAKTSVEYVKAHLTGTWDLVSIARSAMDLWAVRGRERSPDAV